MGTKIQSLRRWEEIIDRLKSVKREDDTLIVQMEKSGKIEIPFGANIFLTMFESAVGKKVAIIRTDIPGKEYLIREAE